MAWDTPRNMGAELRDTTTCSPEQYQNYFQDGTLYQDSLRRLERLLQRGAMGSQTSWGWTRKQIRTSYLGWNKLPSPQGNQRQRRRNQNNLTDIKSIPPHGRILLCKWHRSYRNVQTKWNMGRSISTHSTRTGTVGMPITNYRRSYRTNKKSLGPNLPPMKKTGKHR